MKLLQKLKIKKTSKDQHLSQAASNINLTNVKTHLNDSSSLDLISLENSVHYMKENNGIHTKKYESSLLAIHSLDKLDISLELTQWSQLTMGNTELSHNIKRLENEHQKLKNSLKPEASLKISSGSLKASKDSEAKAEKQTQNQKERVEEKTAEKKQVANNEKQVKTSKDKGSEQQKKPKGKIQDTLLKKKDESDNSAELKESIKIDL